MGRLKKSGGKGGEILQKGEENKVKRKGRRRGEVKK